MFSSKIIKLEIIKKGHNRKTTACDTNGHPTKYQVVINFIVFKVFFSSAVFSQIPYIHTYTHTQSLSLSLSASMDFPDPLTTCLSPIAPRQYLVSAISFKVISCIGTELLYIGSSWLSCVYYCGQTHTIRCRVNSKTKVIHIYQPLHSDRIWHKVNFLNEV